MKKSLYKKHGVNKKTAKPGDLVNAFAKRKKRYTKGSPVRQHVKLAVEGLI